MSSTSPLVAPFRRASGWRALFQNEDWWAIWIGLVLVATAVVLFARGSSIRWLAIAPGQWRTFPELAQQLGAAGPHYLALLALCAAVFGVAVSALGIPLRAFLPSFLLVFLLSVLIYALGQWDGAHYYNLEPPLVALALGLTIANTARLPSWLHSAFRVEFYVKVGIVLLGATLPFTLILWAGPVAVAQATIVSLATFGAIFFVGKRLGLDRRLAATLGAGGAICGVSGSIAVAGAVGAKKEHTAISISLVIVWAIVFIFALPLIARALHLPTGVAGAWIGSSEFADAAGLAAAQAYAGYAGHVPGIAGHADAAIDAYTLMKVIGRDIWIGVWALVLSVIATARWEATGIKGRASVGEIWRRFPKFVLGFLIASLAITAITHGYDYATYKANIVPKLVAPITNLRTWAFIFCFLSIGLTTRFADLAKAGARPFYAFTAGVLVNVILGFLLSAQIFAGFWAALGS